MNQIKYVQPIRDQQQLEDMKWAQRRLRSKRDYILIVLGYETGLRALDDVDRIRMDPLIPSNISI